MKKFLSDKRIKYGTYSTLITLVVIGILIAVNLVVGKFNKTFDMTRESTYSLSDETKGVLERLNTDVNIYTLFPTGTNDAVLNRVEQVISKYTQMNSSIDVSNVDIYLHPDFVTKYQNENTTIGTNSIIVESGDRYRVINYSDYYSTSTDYTTTELIDIEANLTSAIQYVTMELAQKVYFVSGHGEADYSSFTTLVERLTLSNYDIDSVNLMDSDVPQDCTALIILAGERDFSADEAQKVKNYLANDGRAMFLIGGVDGEEFVNLMSVVNEYGVNLENGYVLEGDPEKYYSYPYAIFPEVTEHEGNSSLTGTDYTVYSVANQSVKEMEVKRQGLVIEPLLTTSEDSYIKGGENSSPNKEAGDIEGPFNLAVAVTDSDYTDTSHTTKVVVSGTSFYFIDPVYDSMVINANTTFVVSALNWLNDSNENVVISPKIISGEVVWIDEESANEIKLIGWTIVPGALFIAGFIVWLIRRNK